MIKAILPFLILSLNLFAKTLYRSPVIDFRLVKSGNEFVLYLSDQISHPMAREIQDQLYLLDMHAPGRVIFNLDSGGGNVDEGHKIIDIIDALKEREFEVATRVQNGRMCASMCVPVFLAGDKREAGEVSSFMFHGVTTGWSTIPNPSKTRALWNQMKKRGLKESFEAYLRSKGALSTPGEFWIGAKELYERNSGVITKLLDSHIKKEPVRFPYTPKL